MVEKQGKEAEADKNDAGEEPGKPTENNTAVSPVPDKRIQHLHKLEK